MLKQLFTSVVLKFNTVLFTLFIMFGLNTCKKQVDLSKLQGNILISQPKDSTIFPPDIISPSIIWQDRSKESKHWEVIFDTNNNRILSIAFNSASGRLSSDQWESIKQISTEKYIRLSVLGYKSERSKNAVSGNSIYFKTSIDPVKAPVFYREVPLPFSYANKNLTQIKWRLGSISSNQESKIILENIPVCGNCHSFTSDGKFIGMDVDYANDKGSYAVGGTVGNTELNHENIITWSDYKKEDNELTFGLLSQISPDGRYVVSTVKDRSIFVPIDDNLAFSQLFFPIKGILVIYDRETGKFFSLPGADDKSYVQSNPCWSPDGKEIIFARSKVYFSNEAEKYTNAILPTSVARNFIEGKEGFKFDLYRIPFNNGKGGIATPVKGASTNGMSNYFGRYSPDGKWIVFCKAENFMLLQPDSKLYIIPAKGGEARKMKCNNTIMNSWHSWAPNSRWIVFASKEKGPYTQLYLTHIDNKGFDSPPVLIENFMKDKRAINIPEFVNTDLSSWDKMVDMFSNTPDYYIRIGINQMYYEDFRLAIDAYNTAIELDPNNAKAYYERGVAKSNSGDITGAESDFEMANKLDPANYKLSDIQNKKDSIEIVKLIREYDEKIEISPNDHMLYNNRGAMKYRIGLLNQSIIDYSKCIKLNPGFSMAYYNRGISFIETGKVQKGCSDLQRASDSGYSDAVNAINKYCLK